MNCPLLIGLTCLLISGYCPAQDLVLFSSSRSGNSDIYLMNAKGKKLQQLTHNQAEEWAPVWIDKKHICFLRQEGEVIKRIQCSISDFEETELEHPITCVLDDKNMLYSPLSPLQVFTCRGEVYLLNPKKNIALNLTEEIQGKSNYVSWTNDKEKILFTNNQEGNNEVYRLDIRSGELENLTNHPANDERGELSPDGKYLAFSSNRHGKGDQDIFVMDLDSKEVKNITQSTGLELIARWSNDGKYLYYGSNKEGNWEIYIYTLKKQKSQRLTFDLEFDGDPRIQP